MQGLFNDLIIPSSLQLPLPMSSAVHSGPCRPSRSLSPGVIMMFFGRLAGAEACLTATKLTGRPRLSFS